MKQQQIFKHFVRTKKNQAFLSHPKSMNHTAGLWERERMLFFGILEDFPFVPSPSIHFSPSPQLHPHTQDSRTFFLLLFVFPGASRCTPAPPASGTGQPLLFPGQGCGLPASGPGRRRRGGRPATLARSAASGGAQRGVRAPGPSSPPGRRAPGSRGTPARSPASSPRR